MKRANLLSLVSAFQSLDEDTFKMYLSYHAINIKNDELNDLCSLVDSLKSSSKKQTLFDSYFIGYTIPQIGKEFDLLRIDDDSIVNIELKSSSTPEKIKKQLVQNEYYLSFLNREIFKFSYVSTERKLYTIGNSGELEEALLETLIEKLGEQKAIKMDNLDSLFKPSNYLVSPFNSTEEFIKGQYFLTQQQEKIKNSIISLLASSESKLTAIKAKAGTGKTLLTYDIAKEYEGTTLIVHCGILNVGHATLRDKHGWEIISAKDFNTHDLSDYQLIIIDEAQRIYSTQLTKIIEHTSTNRAHCLFSYDSEQVLASHEISKNAVGEIEKHLDEKPYELTTKIRTNKEIASFITRLFDKNKVIEKFQYNNIELKYFHTAEEATEHLKFLRKQSWKIINYTPSTYHKMSHDNYHVAYESDNAHTVIGQEFNNVVAVIDQRFKFNDEGKLSTNYHNPYYSPERMLFQIVTRTRMKLGIVIINNPTILKRCLEILN